MSKLFIVHEKTLYSGILSRSSLSLKDVKQPPISQSNALTSGCTRISFYSIMVTERFPSFPSSESESSFCIFNPFLKFLISVVFLFSPPSWRILSKQIDFQLNVCCLLRNHQELLEVYHDQSKEQLQTQLRHAFIIVKGLTTFATSNHFWIYSIE